MLTMHCGGIPQITRDLKVASISGLFDLPRKFRKFVELFGNFRKWVSVKRGLGVGAGVGVGVSFFF